MGMFDNLFKNLDTVLKEIEGGGLEKKLDNLAGMVDRGSKQVFDTTDRIAKAPEAVLKIAESKKDLVEKQIQVIGEQAQKAMDIIPRRLN
jgi:hypothetical protein